MLTRSNSSTTTIYAKARDYAARHHRALEAIAAGHATGGAKGDLPPLYLPYYLVRVVLGGGTTESRTACAAQIFTTEFVLSTIEVTTCELLT